MYLDLAEITKAKWVIGNDTGPMHLICQCKSSAKKIVLFGLILIQNYVHPGKICLLLKKIILMRYFTKI